MKPQPTTEERIEAYLLDTMSMDERTRFAEELQLNPGLLKEVELQRTAYAAAEIHSEDQLLNQMSKWEWKHSLPRKLFPLMAAATTVGTIALLYLGWKFWPRQHDYFAENFESYRPPSASQNASFKAASDSYTAGDYERSAQLFEDYLGNAHDPQAEFYAGISYLDADSVDASKAIAHLYVAAIEKNSLSQQAEWYLALAYFENGNDAEARSILEFIAASPQHERKAEALAVLEQM